MIDNERLSGNFLFETFDANERETLLGAKRERSFAAGDVIYPEGAPNASLFIIRSGSVRVWRRVGKHPVRLADMGPGEVFGELSVIAGGVSSATLAANEPTVALEIQKVDLERILEENPLLAVKFWRAIALELRTRLIRSSDAVATYVDINRALVDNPNFREFYALSCR